MLFRVVLFWCLFTLRSAARFETTTLPPTTADAVFFKSLYAIHDLSSLQESEWSNCVFLLDCWKSTEHLEGIRLSADTSSMTCHPCRENKIHVLRSQQYTYIHASIHYLTSHYIALRCVTLHYSTLHYIPYTLPLNPNRYFLKVLEPWIVKKNKILKRYLDPCTELRLFSLQNVQWTTRKLPVNQDKCPYHLLSHPIMLVGE